MTYRAQISPWRLLSFSLFVSPSCLPTVLMSQLSRHTSDWAQMKERQVIHVYPSNFLHNYFFFSDLLAEIYFDFFNQYFKSYSKFFFSYLSLNDSICFVIHLTQIRHIHRFVFVVCVCYRNFSGLADRARKTFLKCT